MAKRRVFRREKRGVDNGMPWGDSTPPLPGANVGPLRSIIINDQSALQVAAVYACVTIIADAVSTLPVYCYELSDDGVRRRLPTPPLLKSPDLLSTRQDFFTQIMISLLLRGNAYGWILERDPATLDVTKLKVLPPDVVGVTTDNHGWPVYRVGAQSVQPNQIVHIKAPSLPGSPIGMSPIGMCRSSIALAHAAEDYGANFFENSAEASGIISVEGNLPPERAAELAQQWMARHQGVNKAHLPAVLTGGAKWTPIAINPDDAQFLQTRMFQQSEIAMMFRVPEHMLGMQDKTSSWGTGIEQMEIGFVTNTLRPWLSRIESALSALLQDAVDVKFDLSGRLRGDTMQRFTAYQTALTNGWLCVDEVRGLEDLPPLPNGEGAVYHQSVQTIPTAAPADVVSPATAGDVAPEATP